MKISTPLLGYIIWFGGGLKNPSNTGSVEVSGSIPLSSTKQIKGLQKCSPFLCLDKMPWESYGNPKGIKDPLDGGF